MPATTVGEQLATLNTKMDQVLDWQISIGKIIATDHDRIGDIEGRFDTYDEKLKRVSDRQGVVAGIQGTISAAMTAFIVWWIKQ